MFYPEQLDKGLNGTQTCYQHCCRYIQFHCLSGQFF